MSGWLAILSLTFVSFAIAAFMLRLPKQGFAVFGAVLLLGLVGYAWTGSPGQPGSPKQPDLALDRQSGEEMVEARRQLFDETRPKPDYLVLSDGFARRGRFDEAAQLLRKGLNDNPEHLEGWLALGMALTGHADGFVTPAAAYAFGKARELDPINPGADYFMGFALLRTGQIIAARDTWASLLERTPDDAPWRPGLESEVARLDDMIARAPMLQ
ncbi:MAG: tetratricopeptide repeat protein [Erythrobacter sp.]|uniref:tetratricopeptide repeat protein n=1 Tax=Erythrobacter sp. TaxID=1042 RepID=UPI003A8B8F27